METPKYLVINPMRIEIEDAPTKNDPFKRYAWWDGTLVKVNKYYEEPYYLSEREEWLFPYDGDDWESNMIDQSKSQLNDFVIDITSEITKTL